MSYSYCKFVAMFEHYIWENVLPVADWRYK